MIKSLMLKNFTVFKDATFDFGAGLNVFLGENGLGKTHVLKLPYAILKPGFDEYRRGTDSTPTKSILQGAIADKLTGVLRPDSLGRLSKRKQGRERTEVALACDDHEFDLSFSFATNSKSEVDITTLPSRWFNEPLVYIPTRELLTIFPGFVSLYENYHLEFEESWRDTCVYLGGPVTRGPRETALAKLLNPIESAIGGKVVLDTGGRFYLSIPGSGNMEIPLAAEGERKLAMLARLVATGSLTVGGALFWDEPEANLNPKLVRVLAQSIVDLSLNGVQVFLATHSLFLMRELEILLKKETYRSLDTRVFGLRRDGEDVVVKTGQKFDDIDVITSLEEDLAQADRFMDVES